MKGASSGGPVIVEPRLVTVVSFLLVIFLGCADHLRCDALMEPHLPASEMEALRAIASKLEISSDVWDFNVNPCSQRGGWVNVPPFVETQTNTVISNLTCGKCDPNTNLCHVVSVLLKSMNLTGVLPEEFANLTHLTILDLSRNVITGSLPSAWRSLPLVNITLNGNRISGVIPDEIGDISSLYYLSLEDNLLEGGLPKSFGRFRNLSRLLLSCNDFVGELPEALGNITTLKDFRIDGTGISGKIPSFIGNWSLLKRLDMQGTSLEGSFPSTLSNLQKLLELRVSDYKGDGTFPPLQNMNLQILILRNCSISGRIPDYIGHMSNLQTLDLSFNKFSGEIPRAFRLQIQPINYMYLTDNMLNGTIPEWMFGNKLIDLSYNSFTGPDKGSCEKNYVNLVSSLFFSGNTSTTWCLMKNLPCSKKSTNYELFINCGGGSVTIDGNDYEEDINGLGESTFFLSDSQRWAYSSTGDFVGNRNAKYVVTNASALKMNNPQLYLSARTAASSLRYYGLCLQRGNYTVKLHFSEIIFTDDKTFSSVGRRFFDVFIQGRKVLEDFNIAEAANGTAREVVKSFIASVDSTLEIHFRWSGKGTNAIPDRGVYGPLVSAISITPNFVPIRYTKKGFPVGKIAGIVLTSCVVIFLATLVPWLLLYKKRRENKALKHFKLQGAHFTLSQIKVATRNFDSANKIGEGGFGPVYKGVLPDGSVIAVKQLSSLSRQGNREFLNEIGMISALQHPNLVKLHGCCIEGNQLLLIYEYLENNSLAHALFGPEETRLALGWRTRWKIILDIARGLAYLHEESRLKIVHRDIKSTNVLLDKDLNAKISDFGLAKLDDESHTHIFTKIAGTIGYMAPEYATRGYLTEKADVYSFGIVVLEIVSGKSNMSCRSEDFLCLLDFANILNEQGKLLDLVDPKLGLNYSKSEAEQLLSLALLCTNYSPKLRPTMTSVVRIMGGEPITDVKSVNENSQVSLKSFGNYSQDGQELSSNRPWIDSSMTISSFGEAVPPSIGSVSSIEVATASSMASHHIDDDSIYTHS